MLLNGRLQFIRRSKCHLVGGALVAEETSGNEGLYELIHSTIQLKIKMNDNGTINMFKAWCCPKGDELQGRISETFSPTISALAFAVVHQLSIIDEMKTCAIDTVGAYLHEDYPADSTPLFLTLAPEVSKSCGLPVGLTYRVRKYLYGFPDAGRAYYRGYSSHLMTHGHSRSISDPSLFYRYE
jgi:hypothetical protein